MNMPNDELHQSLLELHYDLLDPNEADQLRHRIETEAEVATAWADTLRLVGKLASAARIDGVLDDAAKTPLTVPANDIDTNPSIASISPTPTRSPTPTSTRHDRQRFWIRTAVAFAIAASIGFVILGSRYAQRLPQRPKPVLQMQATSTITHRSTGDNEFQIQTRLLGGTSSTRGFRVVPAAIAFSILSGNAELFRGDAQTDDEGWCHVEVPDELVLPKGAKLKVTATPVDVVAQSASLEIPLEPTRCLTYLKTDRPVYRPGETIFFRSVTLNRRSFAARVDVPIHFELVDPSGAVVNGAVIEGVTQRGVGNGAFAIPSMAPGGPYQLVAKSMDGFFPDETVDIQVRAYRVPRFKKEIQFDRRSYGQGDTVQAVFSASRAEGGPVAGAPVRVQAKVDDKVVYQSNATTAADGTLAISFDLPPYIAKANGQLSVMIDDGGTRETKSKTIPIQLGRVEVDFYPEGGYLVDGLINRVYFAARNTLGEPVHIEGEVQSENGDAVATIATRRDGMGRFEFLPRIGQRYSLKVISPVDVTNQPNLPAVVQSLPVLETGLGVFDHDEPLTMTLRHSQAMTSIVRAVCRGQLVGETQVDLQPGSTDVKVPIRSDAAGVIRVTVLDGSKTPALPLVERLVYRRENRRLNISITSSDATPKEQSQGESLALPGESLRMTLQVTDENNRPTPAVLGVRVVDDASLSLSETEQPTMRSHFLLTSEVDNPQDLEHANFYLSDVPEAAESLDLLLGTQGWRRFISGSPDQSHVDFRQQLVRLMELDGASTQPIQKRSSAAAFEDQWADYQIAMTQAWNRLFNELRFLLLCLAGVLLLVVWYRIRQTSLTTAMLWLFVVSGSMIVIGCGVSDSISVVESASSDALQKYAEEQDAEQDAGHVSAQSLHGQEAEEASDQWKIQDAMPMESGIQPNDSLVALPPDRSKNAFDESVDEASVADEDSAMAIAKEIATSRTLSRETLERFLAARGLDAEKLADQLMDELRFPVRQYAHRYDPPEGTVRRDFTETLLWQPMLITDSKGQANIRFDLNDSITSFRIDVDGHTRTGRIGSGHDTISSRIAFQIEPKLPLEVTAGDRIDLPVAVINATDDDLSVNVDVQAGPLLKLVDSDPVSTSVAGGKRSRYHFPIQVIGQVAGDVAIRIDGKAASASGEFADNIQRKLHVVPTGYPVNESIAGQITNRQTITLPIPKDIVAGSLAVTLRAYTSPVADLMAGVESILREPHGCFEQTSATNYPNTMALRYLQKNQIANPKVARHARVLLDKGYGKLVSFECDQRGYEWFGEDPGHEALSAFGLMQFADMQHVMNVDDQMVKRTRKWLINRRDGRGGFKRNLRHLHQWSVDQKIVNAYVLWAISETDVATGQAQRTASELGIELDHLAKVAKKSNDAYLIALSAAALANAQMIDSANALLNTLSTLQSDDGSVDGKTTVTSSGGLSRKVETTSIATLAWLKNPQYLNQASAAAKWLAANRQGSGGFGSTQATVLALKALVAIADHRQSSAGNNLLVRLDGQVIGQAKLPRNQRGGESVEIIDLANALDDLESDATIELVAEGSRNLAYTIDMSYHAITPNSDPKCPVDMSIRWRGDSDSVKDGDTVGVRATIENKTDRGLPMTVAVVGLPGGVQPIVKQLDEMLKAGEFDFYELRGREVVFYWRTIAPKSKQNIDFTVAATVPGSYTGPASRAYLYYTGEQKTWVEPLKLDIAK